METQNARVRSWKFLPFLMGMSGTGQGRQLIRKLLRIEFAATPRDFAVIDRFIENAVVMKRDQQPAGDTEQKDPC